MSIDNRLIFQPGLRKFNTILWRIHGEENRSVQHIIQFTICIPNDHGMLLCDYIHRFLDNVSKPADSILLPFHVKFWINVHSSKFHKLARPNRIGKVSLQRRVDNRYVLTNYFAHGILVYRIENQPIWNTRIFSKNWRQI